MVLYPLNALVEDQLRRLRQTLDSESVLQWMDSGRAGNRVTFGRYTGDTPVSGFPGNDAAVRRLRERLRNISEESDAVRDDPDLPRDARYYFPNIDGGEMWSRWDMQETPSDILITNYHILNIMLMCLLGGQNSNPEALDALLSIMQDYPGRVPLIVIRDKVKQEFLKLGFNPGGNAYNLSRYTSDCMIYQWHECYSWYGSVPQEKAQLPPQANRLLGKIDDSLTSQLMFTLFQHTARTLEGLGAGWATFKPPTEADEGEVHAVESLIRQLGVRRRYTGQPYFFGASEIPGNWSNLPGKTRKSLDSADVAEE